jgi:hypothetical protein
MAGDDERTRIRSIGLVCLSGLALCSSLLAGTPSDLPPIAMGWSLLFHVERATALLAAISTVLLIGWRASRGDFPVRIGQVEYAVREAARDVALREDALEERLRRLEILMDARDRFERN